MTREKLEELKNERQRIQDCIVRCADLGGRMLLAGKLNALHREAAALRAQLTGGQDERTTAPVTTPEQERMKR